MDRSSVAPELHLLDEYEDENLLAYPWYIWCSLLLAERIVDLPRLGTAIRVAQTHRIDLGRGYCPHLSDAEYARWRQVWRAIIFIDTSVIPSPNPPLCCSYLTIADGLLSALAESLKSTKKRHGILSYGYVYMP